MITNTGPIAVTMGEPSGIGGEIAIKAWQQRELLNLPPFFLIDAPQRVKGIAGRLEWDVAVQPIDRPEDAAGCFATHLPVLPLELPVPAIPGQPRSENGAAVISSIQQAVELTLAGRAAAVVTNPIQKKTLYDAGFEYPGHTEFIAKLCRTGNPPIMMLACSELRVVPVTIHQSLAEALKSLRTETIVETALQTGATLASDFGIERPHLAVAALNPHAGEDGSMGREEIDIIRPAIEELKRLGHSVTGPAPADTLFHERARKTYDAAICMYHDQALIPLKTIDFRSGVNITLGLPIVRTSPDHGTALEIAGTGVADEASFVAALKSASGITMHRQRNPS